MNNHNMNDFNSAQGNQNNNAAETKRGKWKNVVIVVLVITIVCGISAYAINYKINEKRYNSDGTLSKETGIESLEPEALASAAENDAGSGSESQSAETTENLLTATEKDFNNFTEMFEWIASPNGKLTFDSTADDAMSEALRYTLDTWLPLWDYYSDKYHWENSKKVFEADNSGQYPSPEKYTYKEPDPLKKFNSWTYERYDADKVDWILENILNVKPDHKYHKETEIYDGTVWETYYYEGYYYNNILGERGGDAGSVIKINSKTLNDNSQYIFKLAEYDYNGSEIIGKHTVVAELHEIDGSREWKIISIKTDYSKYDY